MNIYKSKDGKVLVSNSVIESEELKLLKANTQDAAVEKHVPLISVSGNDITVTVGEVLHPMLEEHYIEFILIETTHGYQVHYLNPGEEPVTLFKLVNDEELVNAYAYCNLHGLWMSSNN